MEERSALSNLPSYVNARGEEAVNRRVVEETTRLERLENRGKRVAHGRPDVATILEGSFKKKWRKEVLCVTWPAM